MPEYIDVKEHVNRYQSVVKREMPSLKQLSIVKGKVAESIDPMQLVYATVKVSRDSMMMYKKQHTRSFWIWNNAYMGSNPTPVKVIAWLMSHMGDTGAHSNYCLPMSSNIFDIKMLIPIYRENITNAKLTAPGKEQVLSVVPTQEIASGKSISRETDPARKPTLDQDVKTEREQEDLESQSEAEQYPEGSHHEGASGDEASSEPSDKK
jgi:hypothetical protein